MIVAAHHQWQFETRGVNDPKWTKYHRRDRSNALQSTWRPLILMLLAFKGEPHNIEEVRAYQRDRWGYKDGETAVIELNALHAPSITATGVDRETYRPQRICTIREHLLERPPTFAVFYGRSYQDYYEQITQAKFDASGFTRCGRTICVLVPQPARSGWTNEEWCEIGLRLRARSDVVERVV